MKDDPLKLLLKWVLVEITYGSDVSVVDGLIKRLLAPHGCVESIVASDLQVDGKSFVFVKMRRLSEAAKVASSFIALTNHAAGSFRVIWGIFDDSDISPEWKRVSPLVCMKHLCCVVTGISDGSTDYLHLVNSETGDVQADTLENTFDLMGPEAQEVYFRLRQFGEISSIIPHDDGRCMVCFSNSVGAFQALDACPDYCTSVFDMDATWNASSLQGRVSSILQEAISAANKRSRSSFPDSSSSEVVVDGGAPLNSQRAGFKRTKAVRDTKPLVNHAKKEHISESRISPKNLKSIKNASEPKVSPIKSVKMVAKDGNNPVTKSVKQSSSVIKEVDISANEPVDISANKAVDNSVNKAVEICVNEPVEISVDEKDPKEEPLRTELKRRTGGSPGNETENRFNRLRPRHEWSATDEKPKSKSFNFLCCKTIEKAEIENMLDSLKCTVSIVDEGVEFQRATITLTDPDALEIAKGFVSSIIRDCVPPCSNDDKLPNYSNEDKLPNYPASALSLEEVREQAELELSLEMEILRETQAREQHSTDRLADSFKMAVRLPPSYHPHYTHHKPPSYYPPPLYHHEQYYPPMQVWAPYYPPPIPPPYEFLQQQYQPQSYIQPTEDNEDSSAPLETSRLYVTFGRPLPEEALRSKFEDAAPGLEYVSKNRDKCFAFVKYSTEAGAKLAMMRLHGKEIMGFPLTIAIAQPPKDAGSRKRQRTSDIELAGKKE